MSYGNPVSVRKYTQEEANDAFKEIVVKKIKDAAGMVIGDKVVTEGKAWIEIADIGLISLNEGFMGRSFNMGEISKGAEVEITYTGEFEKKNISTIKTKSGVIVYRREKEKVKA